jgi:CubicO group peptidase (beta-lactamase class C family)
MASAQNLSDQWVEQAARPLVENRVVDGLSVGYIEGEHYGIVHLGSSGRAGKKATNLTVYEIGSISKVFTGLMLADAVVRGEIDLDAAAEVSNPAGIRLPSRDGTPIKWIDLATHRSGLPRLPSNLPLTDFKNPYRSYDSKKAAEFLSQYELPRKPGESHEYSNFGACVLGYLVAQKAGKTYEQLLRERIAEPLRMTDCTISLSGDQRKRLALPHDSVGSATVPWTFADLPGAGGIRATMRDMMRFAKAQLTPPTGTLGEAIELAWNEHRDDDASGPAMGLGWHIAGDGQTRWHNGGTGGSHAALFVNREIKSAVVVLSNTSADEVDQLAIQLIQKAAGREAKPEPDETSDEKPGDLAIDGQLRSRLVGRYQLTPDFIFDVQDQDGRLMVGITNQPTQEVFPDSPTRWSYRGVEATLEFKLPKTGPATSLILHQNGAQQTAYRIKEPGETTDDESGELAIDAELRRRLVGRYQLTPNFIFDVQDQDGRLMVGITNQPTQEVFPDSPTRWSYRGVDATLEFKLPKRGRASSLILHQNGAQQTARRIR